MRFFEYLQINQETEMNYLLLSHNDLDGYAPEIIMEKAIQKRRLHENLFAIHMNAGDSLDRFIENCIQRKTFLTMNGAEECLGVDYANLLENGFQMSTPKTRYGELNEDETFQKIDCILITDLCPQNFNSINLLRYYQKTYDVPYFIFDHHASAYQNYHDNISEDDLPDDQVVLEITEPKRNPLFHGTPSGTSLFAQSLIEYFNVSTTSDDTFPVFQFANLVREWDTWEWKNAHPKDSPNLQPKRLNTLFNMIDRSEFLQTCLSLENPEEIISENSKYETLLEYNEFLLKKNIRDAKSKGIRYELQNKKKMLIIGDYKSSMGEIADGIFDDIAFADVDVVMSVGFNAVNFRSRNDVEIPFDCSVLARELGGGGHRNAAGAVIYSHIVSFGDGRGKFKIDLK